ncbi:MAG: hypothetical protein ACRC92_00040 [Peptostreptococcaceae bacterium]
MAYVREYNSQKLLVVCNFFAEETTIFIDEVFNNGNIIISNYKNIMVNSEINLRPYECFAVLI